MQTFAVGDRVRVRQWEDMVSEFGTLESDIYIGYPSAFTKEMKPFCGETGTVIKVVDSYAGKQRMEIQWDSLNPFSPVYKPWVLDSTMFEPTDEPTHNSSGDEINIGDTVKVINPDVAYSQYYEWVLKNVPEYAVFYVYGKKPKYRCYTVIAKAPHEHIEGKTIYFIKEKRRIQSHVDPRACYLIGAEGLEKVKE